MPAPNKNTNAQRGDEPASSHLHMRCTPSDKSRWVRAAQARAQRLQLPASETKLAAFVTTSLNSAADAEIGSKSQ